MRKSDKVEGRRGLICPICKRLFERVLYGKEYIVKQSKIGFDSAELNNSMVHDEQEPYEREVWLIFMFRLNLFGIPLVNQKETVRL